MDCGNNDKMWPSIEITEQPGQYGHRFRYESERGSHKGTSAGERTTPDRMTYPSFKVHNHNGGACVRVSCVSNERPHYPHPLQLTGTNCRHGVYKVMLQQISGECVLNGVCLQVTKKECIETVLQKRLEIGCDPFKSGIWPKCKRDKPASKSSCRLCIEVYLRDQTGQFTRSLKPVITQPIYDARKVSKLTILRSSRQSGSMTGGEEVLLFTSEVDPEDIKVRFHHVNVNCESWEAFGVFCRNDVHRKCGIAFKTPPYSPSSSLCEPVTVKMELFRPSDKETSDYLDFTYNPLIEGVIENKRKRKRVDEDLTRLFASVGELSKESSQPLLNREDLGDMFSMNKRHCGEEPRENCESRAVIEEFFSQAHGTEAVDDEGTMNDLYELLLKDQENMFSRNTSHCGEETGDNTEARVLDEYLMQAQGIEAEFDEGTIDRLNDLLLKDQNEAYL